jgi:O-antigen ligase
VERASKLLIVAGAAAILAFDLAIGRAWSGMPLAASALFTVAAIVTAYDRRAIGLVLAFAYVFPALIRVTLETYAVQFDVLWMAALLGAIVPDAVTSRWHIPRRWRSALVCAALSIAVGTSIVVLREIDFNPDLLGPMPGAVLSGLPPYFAEWVSLVGLTLMLGILWFDWLSGAADLDFEATILLPLAASTIVMALVSLYQLFVDVAFLNETVYAGVGRAGGTLYDANVSGTLAAMGIGAAMFFADRYPGWRRATSWTAAFLFACAVWASGSRTASAATVVVCASGAISLWRSRGKPRRVRSRPVTLAAMAAIIVVVTVTAIMIDTTAVGPLQRLGDTLPFVSGRSLREVAAEMWNRNGYGTASTHLIGRFPLSGIGVGSFHIFGPELSPVGRLPPDNAQNWYRHQIVEMGVLGSMGWLVFTALFGWFVLKPDRTLPPSAGYARGIVLAFALISLLGVPTQHVAAAITFWTAAAWYTRLSGVKGDGAALAPRVWLAIMAVVFAFGASTLHAAITDLRVPARARQMGWPYSYGFYDPEPDGAGGEVRWTARRATALVEVRGRTMTLVVGAPHQDIEQKPIAVKVWCEGRLVIDARLATGEPRTATVQVPDGLLQALVDVRVSRTVRPSDFGAKDDRDLGVLVKWGFASAP